MYSTLLPHYASDLCFVKGERGCVSAFTSPVLKSSALSSESLPTERTLCSLFCSPQDWEMPQAQSYPTYVSHPRVRAKGLGQTRALGLGCFSLFHLSEYRVLQVLLRLNTLIAMALCLKLIFHPSVPQLASSFPQFLTSSQKMV